MFNNLLLKAKTYILDVVLCVEYFQQGHEYWATLTLSFILIPAVIVQLFSVRWYKADGELSWMLCLVHMLLLQPLER